MDSASHLPSAAVPTAPTSIPIDVERFRVRLEHNVAAILERAPVFDLFARGYTASSSEVLRRELLAEGLRLTDSMAPELYEAARLASGRLGITTPCEIYQSAAARENAAIHLVESPVLLEVQGRLLAGLDAGTRLAVLGHELGHYLAHGPWTPLGRVHFAARQMVRLEDADAGLMRAASVLSMAAELTADRFGLIACRDLHAALRLEMMTVTGLSGDALTWDTSAYLAQVRELVEKALSAGQGVRGVTHPEHGLRAYALALFSETTEYRDLTGEGPGTRTLADVDATLERFFAREDLDLDFDVLDTPPPELHECALACSVLVALADGDLVEDEELAIERIFAPLVPRFRDSLVREAALEDFYKTGGIVAAYGPSTLRALFQLLIHVMVADRNVDSREADMILAIGRALGCDVMFDSWLAAALQGLGVVLDRRSAEPPELPLPPRYSEAGAALEAFFGGMSRRGGGETNLRRILRLLGTQRATPDVVQRITKAAAHAGLRAEQEFDPTRLDHRIGFALITPRIEQAARPPIEDADRRALTRAITRLRDELVSGDGRSPSVRVRESRRGRVFDLATLERVSTGLAERALAQLRNGKQAKLVTADEVGRHEGAKRVAEELVELDRAHLARLEETGADDLYLGYPVLTGVAGGYFYRAPLVLHSVDLVRDARGARGFALASREDEPPVVNQSLIRLIFHKKGFALPEALRNKLDELAADEAQGPEAIVAELSSLGLGPVKLQGALVPLRNRDDEMAQKREHCEVEECALLGLFPQSSSDLLQDYDALLEELENPNVDLRRLLGAAEELLPNRLRAERVERTEAASRDDARPALHADPSQRAVLNEARTATALVVDGPPGTGKSQVIANLVVDALARGERVAVVCEKRAALDVVAQRIEQLGLRHALGVVHDAHLDRKGLYAQIAARLEGQANPAFDETLHQTVEEEARRIESVLAERTSVRAAAVPGTNLTVGQLQTLVAGLRTPNVSGRHRLERLDEATRAELESLITALGPYADLVRAASPFCAPADGTRRPSMAGYDAARLDALVGKLTHAMELARAHEALAAASPAIARDLLRASPLLDAARESRSARADLDGQRLFVQVLSANQRGDGTASVHGSLVEWSRRRDDVLTVATRVEQEPDPELERRVAILGAWSGRFLRFFVLAWWAARSFVARALPMIWRERAGHPLDAKLLAELRARLSAAHAWNGLRAAVSSLDPSRSLPDTAQAADAFVGRLRVLAGTATTLVEGRVLLSAIGAYPTAPTLDAVSAWEETLDARAAQRDAADAYAKAIGEVTSAFPWLSTSTSSAELLRLRDALVQDGARLVQADLRLDEARSEFADVDPLLRDLFEAAPDDLPLACRAFLRAWAVDTLSAAERKDGRIVQIAGPTPLGAESALGSRLAELEKARAAILVDRVRSALDGGALMRAGQAAPRSRRSAAQSVREAMLKEAKKQRRILPLRAFARRFAAEGLLDVVPVWLLSPETMTILFPREPLFDRVIFDEASQCTVESGFPVLLRANRVVIAGDDKQMPPTSFFAAKTDDDDADESDEVREQRELLADESLLTLASTRVPRRRLSWHYRCRHESLIAFSNHAMYEGQLLTIPSTASPRAPAAVRWHAVAAGHYEEGRNRTEAEEVVNLVHDLLRRDVPPSIGIVTFNLQQRAAVLEAIDGRRSRDADFGARWDAQCAHEQVDQHPFVRNLESVQGDERDVIVFSIGHAPVERRRRDGSLDTYVPARFGPLGLRGGERRLNVAISRAKAECIVVASFEPSMLTVANSRNQGPMLFKQYLEYVHHLSNGRHAQAERTLALTSESVGASGHRRVHVPVKGYVPLATQIALALESCGLTTELDVGTSRFRIPLAVVDPVDGSRFRLAVLTDEGDEEPTPFELFVHRPFVLEQRGFDVLRVTAAEWLAKRGEIVEEVVRRIA